MIRVLILLVICLFLITLNLSNSHTLVSLNYFFGAHTRPVPVAWLVSGVFAAGLALGWLFGLPAWIKLKLELRRLNKTMGQMEAELNERQTPQAGKSSFPASHDPDEF
jgi:uncharacterized membrane protein YciS (DUF1049 family)